MTLGPSYKQAWDCVHAEEQSKLKARRKMWSSRPKGTSPFKEAAGGTDLAPPFTSGWIHDPPHHPRSPTPRSCPGNIKVNGKAAASSRHFVNKLAKIPGFPVN